ncbi:MAG: hypothetical protein ACC662_11750, partial [Planctomycetota bacterium]
EPLGRWLAQDDAVVRALAAFELRRHTRPGAIRLGVEALGRERDPVVLGCLLGSLGGRPRADLVAEGGSVLPALLLGLVEHPHPVLRARAWEILRRLPARDPGPDLEAWQRWWLGARDGLVAEQKALLAGRREAAEAKAKKEAEARGLAPEEGRTTPGGPPDDELFGRLQALRK